MANTHARSEMELYRSFVRKIVVAKPNASLVEIQKQLVANNLPKLHVDTITKIKDKVLKERIHRMNRVFLTMRLGEQFDARTEILGHAWNIVLNPEDNNQKLSAMRLILEEEHNWTKLLILVGILEQGDKRGADLVKMMTPKDNEQVDQILNAIQAQMLPQPQGVVFDMETAPPIDDPKENKKNAEQLLRKPNSPKRRPTLTPVADDRSFAVPPGKSGN